MKCVAGYQVSGESVGEIFVDQALGDGQFAVVLLAAVGALGKGLAGGVETEGDDAAEATFRSEVFAVEGEGEGFGQQVAVFGQPSVEGSGEFDGAIAVDDVVDGTVAEHGQ